MALFFSPVRLLFRFAWRRFRFHPFLLYFSSLGRLGSLRRCPRICRSWFDDLCYRFCCRPPFSDFSPGKGGHTRPLALGDRLWGYWAHWGHFSCWGSASRSLRTLTVTWHSFGPLGSYVEVQVYKKDKSLAFRLRFLVRYPPLLSRKPWIEVLKPTSAPHQDSLQLFPSTWESSWQAWGGSWHP
jgi:hypothetical protein